MSARDVIQNVATAAPGNLGQSARQIIQQEDRIERQKEVIAALENDGHEAMAKDAQRLLGEMLVG